MVHSFQLGLLSLAGLISVFFGLRYFRAKEFMPYHAVVAGRSWREMEPGLQAIILGMLKIIGGGFTSYGLALFWMLVPLGQGQRWAGWAVLTLTVAALVPTLYVTIALRRVARVAASLPLVGPRKTKLLYDYLHRLLHRRPTPRRWTRGPRPRPTAPRRPRRTT